MTGTVIKRPRKDGSASWAYYFLAGVDDAGKRVQVTKSGFGTKREAELKLRDAIAEMEAKKSGVPAPAVQPPTLPVFAEFFQRWMREHAHRKCARKTAERYGELGAYAIRQTVEIAGKEIAFGDVPIDQFGPMQMELMMNALRDRGGKKTKEMR